MKKFLNIFVLAAALVAAVACNKQKEITSVDKVVVEAVMPSDFPDTAKYSGEVILTDQNSSKSYTATAVDGIAEFKDIKFGLYNITVAQTLTNEQFAAMAPKLAADVRGSIALNGSKADITLIDQTSGDDIFTVGLTWSVPSSLVISKIYSYGTLNLSEKPYNLDKYWEIYNNSDQVQYADGLCLGEAYGSAVSSAASVYDADKDNCYLQRVVAIPGNGTDYPIQPGKSIVIAMNAKNHIDTEVIIQTIDLTSADFECYVEGAASSFPSDNADVPNLEQRFSANTYAAKFGVSQGATIVLFRKTQAQIDAIAPVLATGTDAFGGGLYAYYCLPIAVADVIDAVDVYYNKFPARNFKKVPAAVDASTVALDQRSTTERKVAYTDLDGRVVLQDTNNSSRDFVLIAPRSEGGADHLTPRDYTKEEINQ